MSEIYIHHHLGLGDHIIANGIIRTYAEKYDQVNLFCKKRNLKNVQFMFRDLQYINIIPVNDDREVTKIMTSKNKSNFLKIGHTKFNHLFYNPNNNLKIDEIFYKLAEVPFQNKWDKFFVKRDLNKEKEVFKKLGLTENDKYAFVHDDSKRRIQKNKPNIPTIRPENKEYSLFDYLYTIENASEIHCINSSFSCLIDSIGIQKDNMFIHNYVHKVSMLPVYGSNWKIIN